MHVSPTRAPCDRALLDVGPRHRILPGSPNGSGPTRMVHALIASNSGNECHDATRGGRGRHDKWTVVLGKRQGISDTGRSLRTAFVSEPAIRQVVRLACRVKGNSDHQPVESERPFWQMTRGEFHEYMWARGQKDRQTVNQQFRKLIGEAVSQGKPVDSKTLAEYPDLRLPQQSTPRGRHLTNSDRRTGPSSRRPC